MAASIGPGRSRPRPLPTVTLESVLRAGAITGVVLYGLGLMTVNAYLRSYGVYEFGLLQPQYIVTGALVALPAVLFAAGWVLVYEGPDDFSQLSTYARLLVLMSPIIVGVLLVGAFIREPVPALVLAVSGSAAVILGVRAVRSVERVAGARSGPILSWLPPVVGYGLTFLLASAVYVQVFATNIYSKIPPHFGGGQPVWATLVTETPGIESNAPDGMVNAVLLAELDDEYLLVLPYEYQVIRLRKDAVDAMFVWLPWTQGSGRFFVPSPSPAP